MIKSNFFIFLLLILTFLAFSPCLKNSLVNWDDQGYLLEDGLIHHLSWANLKNIFMQNQFDNYHPLSRLSYALEYRLAKFNPLIYHLDNLLLHLANCFLVFWFIMLLSKNTFIALLTAALFAVHPSHVESVAWASERRDVLYSLFFLSALIAYLKWRYVSEKKYYFFALGLFVLAMLSKAMAITLPLVIMLIDYYFFNCRSLKKLIKDEFWFFLAALLLGLVSLAIRVNTGDLLGGWLVNFRHNLSVAGFALLFYLNKLILPVDLSCLYPYAYTDTGFFQKIAVPVFYLLSVCLACLVILNKYFKKIIFGVAFFLITLIPVIHLIPSSGAVAVVFDRYLYISSIGLFYALSVLLCRIYAKEHRVAMILRRSLQVILIGLILLLSGLTYRRCQVWRDSLSLWNDVIKQYPGMATVYNSRGVFFMSEGQYQRAETDFLMAVKLRTDSSDDFLMRDIAIYNHYYFNFASSLQAQGRIPEAKAVFEQLVEESRAYLKRDPFIPEYKFSGHYSDPVIKAGVYYNLANLADASGNQERAVALYIRARQINPQLIYAYDSLGSIYLRMGKQEEAKREFIQAIKIDPTRTPVYIKLAGIYRSAGQDEELKALYKKAVAFNLDFFSAYYYCGNLAVQLHQDRKAVALYRQAIRINPGSKEACLGLGSAYLTIGKTKSAIYWFKKTLELDPDLAVAHHNLALAYYYAKDYSLAVKHSDQASRLGYAVSPKLTQWLEPYKTK